MRSSYLCRSLCRSAIVLAIPEQAELGDLSSGRLLEPEMAKSVRRQKPSARRALQETLLDQVRLDDVLDGVARLGERGRDRLDAHRPAAEALRDDSEIAPVHLVEAARVDLEERKGARGEFARDAVGVVDHGEIAHAPQQPAGDTR